MSNFMVFGWHLQTETMQYQFGKKLCLKIRWSFAPFHCQHGHRGTFCLEWTTNVDYGSIITRPTINYITLISVSGINTISSSGTELTSFRTIFDRPNNIWDFFLVVNRTFMWDSEKQRLRNKISWREMNKILYGSCARGGDCPFRCFHLRCIFTTNMFIIGEKSC